MRTMLILIAGFLTVSSAIAQQLQLSENSIDLAAAVGKTQGSFSAAFTHDWFFGRRKKIVVGLGGRATAYIGRNQYYVTAPAQLTSGDTGPGVIFIENIIANMDTFLISKPNVISVNASINLGYRFTEKFSARFNIDAIGFSLGGEKQGNYINGSQGQFTSGKPSAFNALLISDNDRGSLNSELLVKYKINEKWSARAGFQFLFTEYTTKTEVQQFPEPNDRFRRKSLLFMIGTSITLK